MKARFNSFFKQIAESQKNNKDHHQTEEWVRMESSFENCLIPMHKGPKASAPLAQHSVVKDFKKKEHDISAKSVKSLHDDMFVAYMARIN